jgi:hypothetical protein
MRARYFTKAVVVCWAPSGVAASLKAPVALTVAPWLKWLRRAFLAYDAAHVAA